MRSTTITVYNTPTGYMARWSGEEESEIRRLFGTNTVPAAFGPQADADNVRAIIARLNPGCNVVVANEA